MKSRDGLAGNEANVSSQVIQEIHGMGAEYLLKSDEDELCEYLVTKYQDQLPLSGDVTQEFQQDYRWLAATIRLNLVKRKANFFSRPAVKREKGARKLA
jgi:hypothetical protein